MCIHDRYKVEFPSRSAVFEGPETQRPNAVTPATGPEPEKDSPAVVKNGRPANYITSVSSAFSGLAPNMQLELQGSI